MVQIKPSRKRVCGVLVPNFKLIKNRWHILHSQEEFPQSSRFLQRRHALGDWQVFPYAVIASRMLQKHGHISPRRPMLAEKGGAFAVAPESMTKEHYRCGLLVRRQIDTDRNLTRTFRVLNSQIHLLSFHIGREQWVVVGPQP